MKTCAQCGGSYADDKSACPKCGSAKKNDSQVKEGKNPLVNERMYS